jgi:hypothetical protein
MNTDAHFDTSCDDPHCTFSSANFARPPSYLASVDYVLASSAGLGDDAWVLIRERARYRWLAERVERWVGYYSVPELLEILAAPPTLPGQHSKALVALSLNEELAALAALESIDTRDRSPGFRVLHQISLGEWRWRRRLDADRRRDADCRRDPARTSRTHRA